MTDNTQALASPLGADILTSALVEVMGDADARDAQRLLNALAARGAAVASAPPVGETSALAEELERCAIGRQHFKNFERRKLSVDYLVPEDLFRRILAALRKPAEPVGDEALIRRIEYILDPSASAQERAARRSHLTNHDLRTILAALTKGAIDGE